MILSKAFTLALNQEIDRLLDERIKDYCQSQNFYELVSADVQRQLNELSYFIATQNKSDKLTLYVYPDPDTCPDVERIVDLEHLVEKEITDVIDGHEYGEHLEFILMRLEHLADKLRDALPHARMERD